MTLTERGRATLRGEATAPPLSSAGTLRATAADSTSSRDTPSAEAPATDGAYDRVLFDALRALRRRLADERRVPPYLIFSDASLRDMARLRPRTPAAFLEVKGVGEWKAAEFGERFLAAIRSAP